MDTSGQTEAFAAPEVNEAGVRSNARWWLMAPLLFLLVLINQIDKTNIAVIIADRGFLREMALAGRTTRLGMVATIFFFGYGVGICAWGFLVDRWGPRRCAMFAVCGWAATTLWSGSAHSLAELSAARLILGLFEGSIWPVCNTFAGRWFPVREHGRIQSLWVDGNQVGLALSLPIVVTLIAHGGWRTAFWVLGSGSLLLLEPLLILMARDEPRQSPHANHAERNWIAEGQAKRGVQMDANGPVLRGIAASPECWLVTLCHVGTVAMLFGMATWIPTYLTRARGLPFESLRGWVAWSYTLPIAAALAMGYLADHKLRPPVVGGLTAVAVAVLIPAATVTSNTVLSTLLLLTSLAAPMVYAAMNASMIHRLVAPELVGRATGVIVGVANFVGGIAPTVLGYLLSVFAGQYLAAFGFISAVNVVLALAYAVLAQRTQTTPRVSLASN